MDPIHSSHPEGAGQSPPPLLARRPSENPHSGKGLSLSDEATLSPFLLLDSLHHAIIATDPEGCIRYWNKGAERLYGWSAEEVGGKSVLDVTVPGVSHREAAEIIDSLQRGEDWTGQFRLCRKDGSTFEGEITDKPVFDENGKLVGIIGISEDVTAREDALDALQHSEERFRQAAETVPDILFIADEKIQTVYINKRFTEYTGKPSRYAHGNGWIRILHPDEVDDVLTYWGRSMESGEAAEFRHRIRMQDGSYRWFITRSRPVRDDEGRIRNWFGTSTDVDDIVRAEEEIKALNTSLERRVAERTKQVRALSSALTRAEQRERKRIARFLHDDLQQLLYGIKLKSDALGRGFSDDSVRNKLGELGSALSDAIQTVRSLTIELNPPVLRGEGLLAALDWLAVHLEERYELSVEISSSEDCDVLYEDQRILVFQIIRELLFNVVKHARVEHAQVSLECRNGQLRVQVIDEGIGFEIDKLEDDEIADSYGLFSIRERLGLFGGSLEIDSEMGSGTTMTVSVPIEA